MTDAERLTLIEERYLHLQRHIAEQDKAMLELTEEFARLKQEVLRLRGQMAAGGPEPTEEISPSDERPPHY